MPGHKITGKCQEEGVGWGEGVGGEGVRLVQDRTDKVVNSFEDWVELRLSRHAVATMKDALDKAWLPSPLGSRLQVFWLRHRQHHRAAATTTTTATATTIWRCGKRKTWVELTCRHCHPQRHPQSLWPHRWRHRKRKPRITLSRV